MKKKIHLSVFWIGLCFILGIAAEAQERVMEIQRGFQQEMDVKFGSLETDRIPHGILLDYGYEFASMELFEGDSKDEVPFFTSKEDVKAVYKTMLSANIGETPREFIRPDSLFSRWYNLRSAQHVVLSGSYIKYSRFVEAQLARDKIDIKSNVILDKYVGGVWQNPYEVRQGFVLAPGISSYKGKKLKVLVPRELFITNETGVISLTVDFEDGQGYRNVPWDTPVDVNYTIAGDKIWRYKLVTPSGTYTAQSKMKIIDWLRPVEINRTNGQICITDSLVNVPIRSTRAYQGKFATVDVTVSCSGDGIIDKPLIVIEGFDVGNLLDPENEMGTTDYVTFSRSISLESGELSDLLTENTKEYDIFYINWRNGVDYMQRNAYAVQEVIRWVNSIKTGNEPNVVLGQSMGGVITRYALADMEERQEEHNTRLFISHDAPHLGANIPLSLQYMYRDLTQQYLEVSNRGLGILLLSVFIDKDGRNRADEVSKLLDQPAARQLMKQWVNGNYTIDNSMHTSFFNELRGKGVNQTGYPIKTRNIAMSNGSQCGVPQDNILPGDLLIDFGFDLKTTLVADMVGMIAHPIGFLFGVGATGNNNFIRAALLGILPGKSKYIGEIKAKANYDELTQNIHY